MKKNRDKVKLTRDGIHIAMAEITKGEQAIKIVTAGTNGVEWDFSKSVGIGS